MKNPGRLAVGNFLASGGEMKHAIRFAQKFFISAGLASFCAIPAFSQAQGVLDYADES